MDLFDKFIDLIIGILATGAAYVIVKVYFGWTNWPGVKLSIRILREFTKSGGVNFFSSRKSYVRYKDHGTASEYINKCSSSVYYIGFWLSHGTEVGGIENTFEKVLESGRKVCIVLLDPESETINSCSSFLGIDPHELKQRITLSISKFRQMYGGLSNDAKRRFTLKLHNIPLSASAFLLDSELGSNGRTLLDFKLYGFSRDDSFGMEFRNQGHTLYDKFTQSYLKIKEDAKEIQMNS